MQKLRWPIFRYSWRVLAQDVGEGAVIVAYLLLSFVVTTTIAKLAHWLYRF